jgi:hypothetical protein
MNGGVKTWLLQVALACGGDGLVSYHVSTPPFISLPAQVISELSALPSSRVALVMWEWRGVRAISSSEAIVQ